MLLLFITQTMLLFTKISVVMSHKATLYPVLGRVSLCCPCVPGSIPAPRNQLNVNDTDMEKQTNFELTLQHKYERNSAYNLQVSIPGSQ